MKGVCGRMSRIVDKPYFTYSAYNALTSGIQVKCPKCHGAGVVTADEDNAYFRCVSCGHQETRDRTIYRYDVHNQCKNCGRYYRVDIEDEAKQQFSVLHVACPYCGTTMSGEVHKTAEAFSYIGEIRDGREPYFRLELWFLTSFQGKSVLAEGAQGTMLDIDFGSYPFVTSSNTICAGCCTGLGVSPRNIGEVYGIFKAYCTRVGSGPFPTELFDEVGDKIGQLGHEFGAVTGRKRRCGWIDLVALKYAVMINGVSQLIMMKSDVLDTFDTIKACVAYKMNGVETNEFPYEIDDTIEPVYVELPGWKTDMTKMQSEDEFPEEFNAYLSFLEEELGVPVKIVSVGPDREQTIVRYTEE